MRPFSPVTESSAMARVLHVLSQRPELTGSGITLDALVREGARRGWDQWVACGVPAGDPLPAVGDLPADRLLPLSFGPGGDLPFAIPGMSDVMPYASTVWSSLDRPSLDRYRARWSLHLRRAAATARPDLVHVHHLWAVGALVRAAVPGVPTVAHCHATGLRQLERCSHLASEITEGNRRHDHVVTMAPETAAAVGEAYAIPPDRITPVGAGYRDDLFRPPANEDAQAQRRSHVLFAGKFAEAKGLPWLLKAVAELARGGRELTLHVAGGGSGTEAAVLRRRMLGMAPRVEVHDQLPPAKLADLMRRCAVFVLPSLYEGLPLVLVEARACGCRLVATEVGAVVSQLAPAMGKALLTVPPPRLSDVDQPYTADLPAFVERLRDTLATALDLGPTPPPGDELAQFTWREVFGRVEAVWHDVLATGTGS